MVSMMGRRSMWHGELPVISPSRTPSPSAATHCAAIYRKLGVGDRKAAVQAARDLGIL
ncbi:MAG: hypothetical protein WBP59_04170 [Ilumatobacteraceae bacterium]